MSIIQSSPCVGGIEEPVSEAVQAPSPRRYLYRSLLSYPTTAQWLDEPIYSNDDIQELLSEIGEHTVSLAYRMDIPWEYPIPLEQVVMVLRALHEPEASHD
jgi:hypothetical protein